MINKSGIKTLVLDDEAFTLKLHARMLSNLGFTDIVTSEGARAALELLRKPGNMPELILCDLNMPGMDGVEFVRELVDLGYAGSLILVSGEDERILQSARTLVQAHQIKVLGSCQKPVSPQRLAALLEHWAPTAQLARRIPRKGYCADEVRIAIENKELVNYYQPKVSIATGAVIGVETLVRWRHPRDGLVPPDQFIQIAEENNLINALTRVVLMEAFRQSARWQQAGLSLKVAVNVSMDNLTALDFPEFVSAQANATGVAPHTVILEVTESQLMKDLRAPLDILTRLRLRRFRLSIDDFGTGHSSLAQLRDVPFDELKIDQSFVHGAHSNETIRAIFLASVSLAKELGMDTIAEGVEDQADWDFVVGTHCDQVQGYFIARPMVAAEILPWIEARQARSLPRIDG